MQYLVIISIAVISYLIGSVNFSILLSKAVSGKDIRESGSGNAGATNMLRTHGKKLAITTLILDILKGIAAVLIAWGIAALAANLVKTVLDASIETGVDLLDWLEMSVFNPDSFVVNAKYIAAVCVVIGHNFPIFFGFKGGKGVATSLGVVMMLDWQIGLLVAVVAIAVMAVTRYVSFGSIVGGALFIVAEVIKSIITMDYNPVRLICIFVLGALLIGRHHANIARLIKGTENKLSFSKKKEEGEVQK